MQLLDVLDIQSGAVFKACDELDSYKLACLLADSQYTRKKVHPRIGYTFLLPRLAMSIGNIS